MSNIYGILAFQTKTEGVDEDEVNNSATTLSGASPGRLNDDSTDDDDDDRNGVGVGDAEDMAEEDNYSGYTEEELAFMQRLQQNRNTTAASAVDIPQVGSFMWLFGGQSSSLHHCACLSTVFLL